MKKFGFIFVVFALIFVACGGGGGGGDAGDPNPNTSITNNSMGIQDGETTGNPTATFNYSSDQSRQLSWECSLNGVGEDCQGTAKTFNESKVLEAENTFEISACYWPEGGDTRLCDTTPATFKWTVDKTGPTITIDQKPNDPTNVTSGQITFTHDGASASCDLDGVAENPCISPFSYTNLSEDSHTFTVTSLDSFGNSTSDVRINASIYLDG